MDDTSSALRVYRNHPDARLPTKGTEHSAGFDLYALEDGAVWFSSPGIVKTGISVAFPKGTYGRIAPRSSLAVKHSISTGAGVIDSDFRGEVNVILFNHSKEGFHYRKGERIAQLILEKIDTTNNVIEMQSKDELGITIRGEGAYGSTGK